MVASGQVFHLSVSGFSVDSVVVCLFPQGDGVDGFGIEFVNEGANFGELARFIDANGDFGDFGVSFVATVAGRYTRWGGPRLSVQGEPLIVLPRGP